MKHFYKKKIYINNFIKNLTKLLLTINQNNKLKLTIKVNFKKENFKRKLKSSINKKELNLKMKISNKKLFKLIIILFFFI